MRSKALNLFEAPVAEWFSQTFGEPTKVQEEAWTAIAAGKPVLVSAPTGTGKTLSAFLIFIDRLTALARRGELKQQLYVIYVSPLKSLAADIRENLRRPLDGILREEGQAEIQVAVRTGDTPPKDRQRMVRRPPHILIITPESLFLMLTSKTGQKVLQTAQAVILDELHALIDTKRGAHLMLSIARLDRLCGRPLQRIGLSATIEPLGLASEYLSPEPAVIAAPAIEKRVKIEVVGTVPFGERRKDPVWEELGRVVYKQCMGSRSVIAFSEGRRYAEKLAYYVNLLGGDGFARVHHGSLSKEQRAEVEQSLRDGSLRLLCATSSMELGIDVGEIDQVLQIGCPRTISSTMQRLGRAGHNPGKESVMMMYPRTAPETVLCGMTAQAAREGGVEHAKPPRLCLDVLAQHLVSMAAWQTYHVEDVMEILKRAYTFRDVTEEDVKSVLMMLAGDYEHVREIPVRPRLLYDRLHGEVSGDSYSRMLAVAAGGTIPDKGLYTAKTEDGVKLGELDEEFVYESQVGDSFLLGSFAWRIVRQDKDTVYVTQAPVEGARLPFWKGETKGRPLRTGLAFGRTARRLEEAAEGGRLLEELGKLGLDEAAADHAAGFLTRQIQATGGLPDDRTVIVEHFTDHTGSHQIMVHALFGKKVNTPLALLAQYAANTSFGMEAGYVDDDDGFLLYPYGKRAFPEGLLYELDPEKAREILEASLPLTPVFGMTFRYNAARALMMGMRQHGRQPLWMQRLRSTEMLDSLISEKDHPLIRETTRECLEDQWDIEGVIQVIEGIRAGQIQVREVYVEAPSPMSLPLQWQTEAEEMYHYHPMTPGIRQAVQDDLKQAEGIRPSREYLQKQQERRKLPEDEDQLHSLLMMEGDLVAGELDVPAEWLDHLAGRGLAVYLEPGLWIAAEQEKEYALAFAEENPEAGEHIVRRMLYYRGGQTAGAVGERYYLPDSYVDRILEALCRAGSVVEDEEVYYHAKLYDRARKEEIRSLRQETATRPAAHYAAYMADRARLHAPAQEQLVKTIEMYCGVLYPARLWETILFPRRVSNYTEAMLDKLLAQGDYFWRMTPGGELTFFRYDDIDWDAPLPEAAGPLSEDELLICRELKKRGASFLKALNEIGTREDTREVLLCLAEKGLVCADSFVPVRQWQNQEKLKKAAVRQRVNARVMALSAGRWDLVRPLKMKSAEELLHQYFQENAILCRETFKRSADGRIRDGLWETSGEAADGSPEQEKPGPDKPGPRQTEIWTWRQALEILRLWEYTGRARRGYFIEGMSGAQFIRQEEYAGVTAALAAPEDQVIWLNASDPAQIWGKVLQQPEERGFLNLPGTAVALRAGRPVCVMERQGKVLRVFEEDGVEAAMEGFVRDYRGKRLFPEKKRLILKEYPPAAKTALEKAGFLREMQDYVLYI